MSIANAETVTRLDKSLFLYLGVDLFGGSDIEQLVGFPIGTQTELIKTDVEKEECSPRQF